jgi:hypothetical protein
MIVRCDIVRFYFDVSPSPPSNRVLEILIRMRGCRCFTISMRGRLTLSRIWEFMSRMMGCSAILALSLGIWVNSIWVLRSEWRWSVLIISHSFSKQSEKEEGTHIPRFILPIILARRVHNSIPWNYVGWWTMISWMIV